MIVDSWNGIKIFISWCRADAHEGKDTASAMWVCVCVCVCVQEVSVSGARGALTLASPDLFLSLVFVAPICWRCVRGHNVGEDKGDKG